MNRYDNYKDCGISWIGEIPRHWEVRKLSGVIRFGKGLPITKADLKSEGCPVISYGQIHSKQNVSIFLNKSLYCYVSPDFLKTNSKSILNKYDFAFADTSEDFDGSGNFVINDTDDILFAGYHTIIVRLINKDINPLYLACFINSDGFRNQIRSKVNGVKVFSISKGIIKSTFFLLPPLPEQRAIVDFLKSKTSKIDDYVAKRERERAA